MLQAGQLALTRRIILTRGASIAWIELFFTLAGSSSGVWQVGQERLAAETPNSCEGVSVAIVRDSGVPLDGSSRVLTKVWMRTFQGEDSEETQRNNP